MRVIDGCKKLLGLYQIESEIVNLQRFICGFSLSDEGMLKTYGLSVRHIDYDSEQDLQQWCDVINNSYDDSFDISKARKYLKNHILFEKGNADLFL